MPPPIKHLTQLPLASHLCPSSYAPPRGRPRTARLGPTPPPAFTRTRCRGLHSSVASFQDRRREVSGQLLRPYAALAPSAPRFASSPCAPSSPPSALSARPHPSP